jgi:endonuclease/exonuclease/phosphatase (EEP) superfamily protein YafD
LACALWLVFVVLHLLLSGRFYWWGPFDLLPPFVFVLVPLVLVPLALLARPRRVALLPAAALVLSLNLTGLNFGTVFYSPPPAPPGAIKLVTWNTEYWDQDVRASGRTTADFYRYLQKMDADVYLLQEYAHADFTRPDVFAQALVIDQLSLLRQHFPGYEIVLEGRNLTLSRLPVVGHHALFSTPWLPDDLKPIPAAFDGHELFYTSQVVRTDIRVGGRVVSFYNTHLFQPPRRMLNLKGEPGQSVFQVDRFNFAMRRASLEAIRADVKDNRQPIVLAGDLNTSPSMGMLRMLPTRLVDHTNALSSLYPATWEAGGVSGWRLDWLFTTPDITVNAYAFLDPEGLSDHRLQRAVLSI